MSAGARISVISNVCVRLEYSASGVFVDAPSLFAANRGSVASTRVVSEGESVCVIETDRLVVRYRPDGRAFHAGNVSIELKGSAVVWRPGMHQTRNLGGTLETLDRVRSAVALPEGLLSRDGWYVVDDSTTHVMVDGWPVSRAGSVDVDWYFFGYGTDYRAALRSLGMVAGPAPMPRRYALGSWYSRYWPYTSAEYREIVGEYDARGLPLDVIVMDMDWHKPGWTGWSWNRELLPDAEQLLAWFHERGLAVTLNLHPADGVGPHEDAYPAFMRAIGRDPNGETVKFDVGDRRYATALFDQMHAPLEAGGGVDFWWLDWQQEKFTRSIPDLANLRWLNELYFRHTSRDGKRGLSFSRWAGWGDHRHPVHFSGDAHTGWESLAFQVPFTAVAGNVGCFYWSHDIGGHFGPRLEEATTRWVQFGALSPVLRLHSARSGALDRRPWMYKPEYAEAMRKAFRLRSELFPYIYSMARKCHTEMVPLCRPMYLDWPAREEAYENPQQYMFGDAILVAPIVSPGVGEKKVATVGVWFPEWGDSGASWYQWETGERYEGGSERLVAAEIDEIPMFVPGGVPIVTREPTLRMATEPLRKIVVVCYPGEAGQYEEVEVYEDDGVSDRHERGAYAVTPVRARWRGGAVDFEIGIRVGGFADDVDEREVVVELRGVSSVSEVKVDGVQRAGVEAGAGRTRIDAGVLRSAEIVRVSAKYVAMDADAALKKQWDRRVQTALGKDGRWAPKRHAADGTQLSPDNDVAVYKLFGQGFRVDGSVVHAYGLAHAKLTMRDTLGDELVASHDLRYPAAGWAARIEAPGFHVKPTLGRAARRVVMTEETVGDEVRRLEHVLVKAMKPLSGMRVAGPFAYDPTKSMSEQRYGPELVDVAGRAKASFVDTCGRSTTWRECPAGDYWPNDMHRVCGGHNGEALAYAMTSVWSPVAQGVELVVESGDRVEVWVGAEKVFTSDGVGGGARDVVDGTNPSPKQFFLDPVGGGAGEAVEERARVRLEAGWNQIMVKTNEGGGGWGVRVSIAGSYELKEGWVVE